MTSKRLSEISAAELNEIIARVRRDRGNTPGLIGYRIVDEDLRGLDLTGFSIFECHFKNCNLENALFYKTKLVDCEFGGGTMRSAQLTDASITNTQFASLVANGICFDRSTMNNVGIDRIVGEEASFADVHVSYAAISNSTFTRARITGSELIQATLASLKIENSDFSGTQFRSCAINRTDMRWCTFTGSQFNDSKIQDRSLFERCNFSDVAFESVQLDQARVYGCLFRRCSFPQTKFAGGGTTHCCFENCNLHQAVFRQDMSNTEIVGGNVAGIDAVTDFQPTKLPTGYRSVRLSGRGSWQVVGAGVSLARKVIGDLEFTRIRLADVMDDSSLCETAIINVDMSKSSWRNADFSGATMSFVNLIGADFSGANFRDLRFERLDKPSSKTLRKQDDDRGLYELHSGTYLYPALYDNNTVWPDGFVPTDIMCRWEDLNEAKKLNASFLDVSTASAEGLVFLPSPDPFCKFLYVYAAMPELFDIVGSLAVPTRAARVLEAALSSFAASVRKDDSGNKFDSFRQRLELGAALIAEELTPSRVRATQDVAANPSETLCNILNERLLQRRRSAQYAAKKNNKKTSDQAT
jgi:uncharacterized protein YjbI with pentapeptide repeats